MTENLLIRCLFNGESHNQSPMGCSVDCIIHCNDSTMQNYWRQKKYPDSFIYERTFRASYLLFQATSHINNQLNIKVVRLKTFPLVIWSLHGCHSVSTGELSVGWAAEEQTFEFVRQKLQHAKTGWMSIFCTVFLVCSWRSVGPHRPWCCRL